MIGKGNISINLSTVSYPGKQGQQGRVDIPVRAHPASKLFKTERWLRARIKVSLGAHLCSLGTKGDQETGPEKEFPGTT